MDTQWSYFRDQAGRHPIPVQRQQGRPLDCRPRCNKSRFLTLVSFLMWHCAGECSLWPPRNPMQVICWRVSRVTSFTDLLCGIHRRPGWPLRALACQLLRPEGPPRRFVVESWQNLLSSIHALHSQRCCRCASHPFRFDHLSPGQGPGFPL